MKGNVWKHQGYLWLCSFHDWLAAIGWIGLGLITIFLVGNGLIWVVKSVSHILN